MFYNKNTEHEHRFEVLDKTIRGTSYWCGEIPDMPNYNYSVISKYKRECFLMLKLDKKIDLLTEKTIEILINNDIHREIQFKSLIQQYNGNVKLAAIFYRKFLYDSCSVNVPLNQLEITYKNLKNTTVPFHSILQELFLEYIPQQNLIYIIKCIEKNAWTMDKLFEEHMKNYLLKVENIVSCTYS